MEVASSQAVSFGVDSDDGLSFGASDDEFEIESSSKTKSSITQPKIPTNPSISYIAGNKLSDQGLDSAIKAMAGSKAEEPEASVEDDLFGSPASSNVVEAKKESPTFAEELNDINYRPPEAEQEVVPEIPAAPVRASSAQKSSYDERSSFISDEDSARVHGTIRQLREEREELLEQIKNFKSGMRELQQDNLTLKAALDDIKIEYSIIKKRHLSEVEDLKDRIAISEKKKIIAEDKAKVIELQKQKLEQKIKIDYNQVKQREKTLESQLEMITIELDSRIQIREQKILELNRKIESLEFNMENIAFRDQKSQDDKRKLEDKLSKIMKTLRHSIKNLEDDIDLVSDEIEEQVMDDESRSGKTKL
jgi:chromosome segregation ATPase